MCRVLAVLVLVALTAAAGLAVQLPSRPEVQVLGPAETVGVRGGQDVCYLWEWIKCDPVPSVPCGNTDCIIPKGQTKAICPPGTEEDRQNAKGWWICPEWYFGYTKNYFNQTVYCGASYACDESPCQSAKGHPNGVCAAPTSKTDEFDEHDEYYCNNIECPIESEAKLRTTIHPAVARMNGLQLNLFDKRE